MKISTRITISTLVMVSITLFLVTTEYLGMLSLYRDVEAVEEVSRELNAVSSLHFSVQEALLHLNGYLIAMDPAERKKFEEAVNEALRRAQQMVSEEMSKVTGSLNIPGLGNLFGQ